MSVGLKLLNKYSNFAFFTGLTSLVVLSGTVTPFVLYGCSAAMATSILLHLYEENNHHYNWPSSTCSSHWWSLVANIPLVMYGVKAVSQFSFLSDVLLSHPAFCAANVGVFCMYTFFLNTGKDRDIHIRTTAATKKVISILEPFCSRALVSTIVHCSTTALCVSFAPAIAATGIQHAVALVGVLLVTTALELVI